MNQPTKAFLIQLAALCDAYGVDFYGDSHIKGVVRRVEGVVFRRKNPHMPHINVWVTSLDDLKAKLANDQP